MNLNHWTLVGYLHRQDTLSERLSGTTSDNFFSSVTADNVYMGNIPWANVALHFQRSPLYVVAAEMVDVLSVAGPQMPNQPLLMEDLLTPSGFVVFEKPLQLANDYPLKYLFWHHMPPSPILESSKGGVLCMGHQENLDAIGLSLAWSIGWVPDFEDTFDFRMLSALWTFLRERITEESQIRTHRIERVSQRMKRSESFIRIVRLRRSRHSKKTDSKQAVDWSHRWITSGHWKNHWYPKLQTHRGIWIAPFVKGPEDKPLIVKDTIYAWVK